MQCLSRATTPGRLKPAGAAEPRDVWRRCQRGKRSDRHSILSDALLFQVLALVTTGRATCSTTTTTPSRECTEHAIIALLPYILCTPSRVQGLLVVFTLHLGIHLFAFKQQLFCPFRVSLVSIWMDEFRVLGRTEQEHATLPTFFRSPWHKYPQCHER